MTATDLAAPRVPAPERSRRRARPRRRRSPFGRTAGAAGAAVSWARFLPFIAPFGCFALAPAIATFGYSATDLNGLPGIPTHWIGLENYRRFFGGAQLSANLAVIWRTVALCLILTVVQNIIALGLAVVLNTGVRGGHLWRAILFMPTILGVTVTGLTWTLVFDPNDGPVARALHAIGWQSSLLGDSNVAFYLVIGVMIWSGMGYAMVIYLSALQTVPPQLKEAAQIDGASRSQIFRKVTYPLLANAVTTNVLLCVIGSLQSYQLIYVLTRGKFETSVLATRVVEIGFQESSTNQGYASAVSVIQFVVVLLITAVTFVPLRARERRLD